MSAEHNCFCELAPLYALNQLSEEQQRWVEQQLAECPELAAELADYQLSVTALAYTVPALPMADDLKQRLLEQLKLDPQPQEAPPESVPVPELIVQAQDLNWQPHPTPGVQVAIAHVDPIKREIVGFLRAAPGVRYPLHRHAAVEELLMLEGDLVLGDRTYGAGDYIRSHPGSSHAPYTHGGCRFFFRSSLDDEYLEPTGAAS